jgi:hypothetical protein
MGWRTNRSRRRGKIIQCRSSISLRQSNIGIPKYNYIIGITLPHRRRKIRLRLVPHDIRIDLGRNPSPSTISNSYITISPLYHPRRPVQTVGTDVTFLARYKILVGDSVSARSRSNLRRRIQRSHPSKLAKGKRYRSNTRMVISNGWM